MLVWLLSFDLIFGGQGLSLKWKDGYEQLKDDDKSWGDDYDDCENLWKSYPRVPLGSCYLPPVHPLHKENNVSLKQFYFASLYHQQKTRIIYHRNVIVLMNRVVLISC